MYISFQTDFLVHRFTDKMFYPCLSLVAESIGLKTALMFIVPEEKFLSFLLSLGNVRALRKAA